MVCTSINSSTGSIKNTDCDTGIHIASKGTAREPAPVAKPDLDMPVRLMAIKADNQNSGLSKSKYTRRFNSLEQQVG